MQRWSPYLQRLLSLPHLPGAAQSMGTSCAALPQSLSVTSCQRLHGFHSCSSVQQEFVTLNNLSDNPGAARKGKRLGRGIGSGKGKTSGRGHKGQKARTGRQVKIGFEGGQNPIKRATPKRGFHNPHAVTWTPLNLSRVKDWITSGRLETEGVVTMKDMRDCGLVRRRVGDGIKLLARGMKGFNKPVHLQVSQASAAAREAVEKAGGSVTTVYYNKLGLKALLQPDWFAAKGRVLPRAARPPSKLLPRYNTVGSLPPDLIVPEKPPAMGNEAAQASA